MADKKFFISLLFILGSFRLLLIPIGSGDLAIWIADGLAFLNSHTFQNIDIYTVHQKLEFIYPARIMNIVFGAIYKYTNHILGVVIFIRLSLFLALLYFYQHIIKEKTKWNIYNFFILSLCFLGLTLFLDRPAVLGLVCFIVFLTINQKEAFILKDYLKLTSLFLIWNNVHSSVLILLPYLLYRMFLKFIQKNSNKRDLVTFLIFFTTLFMTPESVKIIDYVYATLTISKGRVISEWTSAFSFHHPTMSLLYLVTLGAFLIKFLKEHSLRELFKIDFLPYLFLGFVSIRHSVWFFAICPILFHRYQLWSLKENYFFKNKIINLSIIMIFGSYCFANSILFYPKNDQVIYSSDASVKISDLLNASTQEHRIFNQWELGSYLILKQPHPIFIDTRNIIYPKQIFEDYRKILNCFEKCDEILNKYKLDTFVLKKEGWPFLKWLKVNTKVLYEDNLYIYSQSKVETSSSF